MFDTKMAATCFAAPPAYIASLCARIALQTWQSQYFRS